MMKTFIAMTMSAAFLTQGCSLVGLGIGATSPKYEPVEPPYDSLPLGADVRIVGAPDERPVEGRYRGDHAGHLFVETEWGGRALDRREVVEVQRRSGSHWAEGLAVGLALDVIVGSLLAVEIANSARFQFSVGPWN